jgi:hypothetical protein
VASQGLFPDITNSLVSNCSSGCTRDVCTGIFHTCATRVAPHSQPVSLQLAFNTTTTTGTYVITITVRDTLDSSLVDVRTRTVTVSSARRRRTSLQEISKLVTSFSIQNGVLSMSLGNQVIGEPATYASTAKGTQSAQSTIIAIAVGVGAVVAIVAAAMVIVPRKSSSRRSLVIVSEERDFIPTEDSALAIESTA